MVIGFARVRKLNKTDLYKVVTSVSGNGETWDHCAKCHEHTPIADINLSSGRCFRCQKASRKYTEKQLRELCKLDVGLK